MYVTFHKLDNPAWYSLSESHHDFAIGDKEIKRYQKSIAPFLAYQSNNKDILNRLDHWVEIDEFVFIIGDLPELPSNYIVESELPCAQMDCTFLINVPKTELIDKLEEADAEEMMTLIDLVQPGYYKPGTRLMGEYFGIRIDGKLVAMTGERMRMDGLTEISAVVTHPEFTGRKYAQQLVAHTANKNLSAGIIPFLHVAETNERAIKIYELLGFVQRRVISFHKIKRLR